MGSSSGLRIEKPHKLKPKSEKRKEKRNGSVTIKGILGKGTGGARISSIDRNEKKEKERKSFDFAFSCCWHFPLSKSNQSKATSSAGALLVVDGVQKSVDYVFKGKWQWQLSVK